MRRNGTVFDVTFGQEGPAHDPYGVTTYRVERCGLSVVLRSGILVTLTIQADEFGPIEIVSRDPLNGADLYQIFEQLVGGEIERITKAYYQHRQPEPDFMYGHE